MEGVAQQMNIIPLPSSTLKVSGLVFAFLLLLLPAQLVLAATITVDSNCSLANAIRSANGAAQVSPLNSCETGDSGVDTIRLTAYITLAADTPVVTSALTIEGNGRIIDGNDSARILYINVSDDVTVNNVIVANGNSGVNESAGGITKAGSGTLTITGSVIRNNSAPLGGGIVQAAGSLIIKNSSFYGNVSRLDGGAIYAFTNSSASLTVINSTFYDNRADLNGGAIFIDDIVIVTLTHVTMHNNRANDGAIRNTSDTITIRNSIISGTTSDGTTRVRDCFNPVPFTAASGGNLIEDGSCSAAYSGSPGLASSPSGSIPYFTLLSTSNAIDRVSCSALPSSERRDQRGTARPKGSNCDIGAYEYDPAAPPVTRSRRGGSSSETAVVESMPAVCTGDVVNSNSDLRLSSSHGLCSGIQFQRVGESGVGIQPVIDMGFVDAVDVWGWVSQGAEVCFQQSGGIVFLDAATSPRTVTTVTAYTRAGMTCAAIDRAGTVVLVSSLPAPPPLSEAMTESTALTGCMVTTTAHLNFRGSPGGQIIGLPVPEGSTLTANARTVNWFQVDNHGTNGWISAGYVTTEGSCA